MSTPDISECKTHVLFHVANAPEKFCSESAMEDRGETHASIASIQASTSRGPKRSPRDSDHHRR